MIFNFCTYFDSNYLYRGLALFFSLKDTRIKFKLWILCFDDETYELIKQINFKEIELISINDFEKYNPKYFEIKSTRSKVEYYWTSTPLLPKYILSKNQKLDHITYLDADLLFFNNPSVIFNELANKSVYIIPHRFNVKIKEKSENDAGKFNVGLILFRNDSNTEKCLDWWSDRCIEWCYDRIEGDKCGDQKYLDKFPELFQGVEISENIGVGIGEWNLENYELTWINDELIIEKNKLVVFHFNCTDLIQPNILITNQKYKYNKIYKKYSTLIRKSINIINDLNPDFNKGLSEVSKLRILYNLLRKRIYYF